MPNQSDYKDGVMINPYFMDGEEKEIFYAGYKEGRTSYAFEKQWTTKYPNKEFRKGIKKEYIEKNYLGPSVKELEKEYPHGRP